MGRATGVLVFAALLVALVIHVGTPSDRIRPLDPSETWLELTALAAGEKDRRDRDPPSTIDELRQEIGEILEQHDIPGVGIALVSKTGVLWAGGVGKADRETDTDVGPDTMFRVASISKSVIALAVVKLAEQGRIRLDTPVEDIAPEIAVDNAWADSTPITVAQLLEHTAGFDDMRFNEMYVASDGDDRPLAEILAINPRSRVSRWPPGSRHAYSNPGYTVAGYVIEKVTGEPFERYIEREILRPLAMNDASFTLTPTIRGRLARGYSGRRNRPVPHRRIYHRPAGELMASPAELARLVKLFIDRGQAGEKRLVSAAAIARMERSETTSLPVLEVAYGLGTHGDPSHAAIMRGHDGGLPGFVSEYRYSTALGLGYVMLFNSTTEAVTDAFASVRRLLFAYLTRDRELPSPPAIDLPERELQRYAGYYEFESPRYQLTGFFERVDLGAEVVVKSGTLYLELGIGLRVPLIATETGRFRAPGLSAPLIAFGQRSDGTRIMLLGDLYYEEGNALWGKTRQRVLDMSIWFMDVGVFAIIVWLPGWLWVVIRTWQRFPLPPGSLASLASIGFFVMMRMFDFGSEVGALGEVGLLSGTIFALSVLFPVLSVLAVVQSIQWLRPGYRMRGEIFDMIVDQAGFLTTIYQSGWRATFYSLATSVACLIMAVFLAYHGFIALCTWSW
ncbi:MAG: beta-lactamase family protein [Proteobacteria bacterium]|nr:beta-lactamase family protein [Pseudomonadota bacterium]